ncbi:hypothetical protein BVC80_8997g5 [Macleaya cordata]|uniref:Transmembrane protein n=1 Tax=Macleaya cordata TaxID=56857 RepID=A0A200QMD0_MACCD|nr:hypothetical protein BVC80_8997g5 [Macleaya cordata]
MARLLVLCLILVEVLSLLAMAHGSESSESNVPNKVGIDSEDHQHKRLGPNLANPPSSTSEKSSLSDESKTEDQDEVAEAPEIRRMGKHHHHSSTDESIAGGGVIIGGLATAIFAAVFCYIRVTRRRNTTESKI